MLSRSFRSQMSTGILGSRPPVGWKTLLTKHPCSISFGKTARNHQIEHFTSAPHPSTFNLPVSLEYNQAACHRGCGMHARHGTVIFFQNSKVTLRAGAAAHIPCINCFLQIFNLLSRSFHPCLFRKTSILVPFPPPSCAGYLILLSSYL
jgi:hypothetical protein